MTAAVIVRWRDNSWLRNARKARDVAMRDELLAVAGRAYMPKVFLDIWLSDQRFTEPDVVGQWADDGGRI